MRSRRGAFFLERLNYRGSVLGNSICGSVLPCEKFVEQSDEFLGGALIGERGESANVGKQDAATTRRGGVSLNLVD